jgi:uridine kinase
MHIVTISGLSGSGKTLLAQKINEFFNDSLVISLDNYSFDKEYLYSKYGYINFSHPTAFNHDLFIENIKELEENGHTLLPQFDIAKNKKMDKKPIQKPKILIVEGMYAQRYCESINTIDIFIEIDLDIALIRKIQRDKEERNRDVEVILNEHLTEAREAFVRYLSKQKNESKYIFNNNKKIDIDEVLNQLKKEF